MSPAEGDRAPRRVVLAPGKDPQGEPEARLVLGFDRDGASQAALAAAVDLAGRLRARLTVVHIGNLGDYPVDPDTPGWEQQAQENLADERRQVERALQDHAFGWSYEAWYGPPGDILIRVADDQDALMVIIGRHGQGLGEGLRRLLNGSVSRAVINKGARPVLVVSQT